MSFIVDRDKNILHSMIPKCGTNSLRATFAQPPTVVHNDKALTYTNRIMWIRSPLSRLVSAYHFCQREFWAETVTWRMFIDLVLDGDHKEKRHWTPQTDVVTTRMGTFIPTRIHRFENISALWSDYSDLPLKHLNVGQYGLNFFTNYRMNEIQEYYREDNRLWNLLYNEIQSVV